MSESVDRLLKYASALYGADRSIAAAIAYAPDDAAREELGRAEAEIRTAIRRAHLPSPDEPRMWVRGDSP